MNKGSQTVSDLVLEFAKVLGSKLTVEPDTGEKPVILYFIQGSTGEFDFSGDVPTLDMADQKGEIDEDADVYGQIGILARPLEPERLNSRDLYAEVVCVKTSDGLVPIAGRDTRIRMPGNAPHEGTVALAGYGGGFISFDPVDPDNPQYSYDGTIMVWYCPYDFDSSGVAQKAHSISIDPTFGNSSICVVHAEGQAILLQEDGSITAQSKNGQNFIKVDDSGITMQAVQLILNGGAVVVGNPLLPPPVPLLAGAASPPCPRLFVSPTP